MARALLRFNRIVTNSTPRLLAAVVLAILALFPFGWIVLTSFKSDAEIHRLPLTFWPEKWHLENYTRLWSQMGEFLLYYRNSAVISAATIVIVLAASSLAAYGFARFDFSGKRALFLLFLSIIMLPGEVALIPLYEMMSKYGLLNSKLGLTLAYSAGGLVLPIFLLRNVFESIPREVDEMAQVDGCSPLGRYWHVILPLARNGLVTVAIITGLGTWNEFILAFVLTYSPEAQTLPIGIVHLRGQWEYWDYGILAAAVMLSFLPMILLFIALQRFFVRGLLAGAVKA